MEDVTVDDFIPVRLAQLKMTPLINRREKAYLTTRTDVQLYHSSRLFWRISRTSDFLSPHLARCSA